MTFVDSRLERKIRELGTQMHGVGAYQVLKTATEVFLLFQCGVRIEAKAATSTSGSSIRTKNPPASAKFVDFGFVKGKLREYLGTPPQLPYITRVAEAAFPELLHDGIFSRSRGLVPPQ